jgi:protein O-GlcNAc transferase
MSQRTLTLDEACQQGLDFQMAGRPDLAEDLFLKVLAVDATHPHALYLYGNLALLTGRYEIAATYLSKATQHWPGLAVAHAALGKTYRLLNRLPQASLAYGEAFRLCPQDMDSLEHLLELKRRLCDWSQLEQLDAALLDAIGRGITTEPFKILLIADNPSAQLASARNTASAVGKRAGNPGPRQRRPLGQGIMKIGYLCADFHDHPLAVQYAKVPALHDRQKFHVTAYVQNPLVPGSAGQVAIDGCDAMHEVAGLSTRELAACIDADGIDLLIDLSGFTTALQKEVLLQTSAPVTINYFGWPGSMGGLCDAIIADPIIIPPELEKFYDEAVFRLATTYQPNDPERAIGPTPDRRDEGLEESAFVLACFVQPPKITQAIFQAWMEILNGIPSAVLWLWRFNEWMEANLKERAAQAGIDPDRLIFAKGKPRFEHTARYRLVDLALDTPIYGGHSTTSDALWAGCPVLGLLGRGFPARVSASLLTAAKLEDLISTSPKEYVARAIQLARDRQALAAIRARLNENRDHLPLFDIKRFTKEMDEVLLEIARQASQGRFR